MSRLLEYFVKSSSKPLTILVATSGDTGSAVANGFYKIPGIRVIVLYPSGKISEIQEKQITTLNANIMSLEVNGSFDDCQRLVKSAFADTDIRNKLFVTSANSINIARLIPQTFYYFYAAAQYFKIQNDEYLDTKLFFSVPSGNFGNLTSGILSKKMGLPIEKFVASTNINDTVPLYLLHGNFIPKPSQQTISNAMDVGNPSNFARILALYANSHKRMTQDLVGYSFTDKETKEHMRYLYDSFGYIADPHGAVASLGAFKIIDSLQNSKGISHMKQKSFCIFLETAHPAKFPDIVEPVLGIDIPYPKRLMQFSGKKKSSITLDNDFTSFKDFLLSLS